MSGPLERVLNRQVMACLESNPTWSVDEVQSHLLKAHREYQRKPQTPLRGAISRALQSHRAQQNGAAGGVLQAGKALQPGVIPVGPELLPDTGRHLNDHLQSLYQNASASLDGNGSAVGSLGVLLDQLNKSPKVPFADLRPVRNDMGSSKFSGQPDAAANNGTGDQEQLPSTPAHTGEAAERKAELEEALHASGVPLATPASQQQGPAAVTGSKGKRSRASDDLRTGKASKRARSVGSFVSEPRAVHYSDLGGIDTIRQDIQELIENPLRHPEVYAWLGVEPPRGVLLHGPPGCGKTDLAHAIANECGVPFLRISAPEIVAGVSGESEAKVRQLFEEAQRLAPCIIFIDEIDAIASKRENAQREMERRIVAQMLTCMDDLSQTPASRGQDAAEDAGADQEETKPQRSPPARHVVIIDALDAALRRAGRFDREISMGIPSEATRASILKVLCKKLRLAGEVDFKAVAARTPGFVGADLRALTKEAAASAIQRIFQQPVMPSTHEMVTDAPESEAPASIASAAHAAFSIAALTHCAITMGDFETAIPKVQPSVRREGFATTPDVTWADVGALPQVRAALEENICLPISDPEVFRRYRVEAPTGVLLYGPPGCGKTLVAKAVANEAHANFISIKGPELLNKYVGESERAVRQLFARASAAAPCVLFFDEMDALAPRRGADATQSERVVNQLLTEMDGVVGRKGVYMVAATNRPDIIDPALVRPGRLGKMLLVPLPTAEGSYSRL
ncbi:hypothetical protein WJX84_009333 [Apatococcus fuscideae]|uniref:AAA+ ATPase domain-containing protein n=1 Tax=Apatococcus fuscideae TaxID=2026836 RepID=A0AAW1TJ88_9CHLO